METEIFGVYAKKLELIDYLFRYNEATNIAEENLKITLLRF